MKRYRYHYRFLITLAFNIGLFYLLYVWLQKNIHLHALIIDMGQTNLASMFFVFSSCFLILILYGWRLSLLLKVNFKKSFSIIGIGNGLNNLLPFRLGDVIRIYFAKRLYGIGIPHSTAATFLEKYFDLVILLIFGSVILFNHQYGLEMNALYLFIILVSCSFLSVILYRYLILKESFLKQWLCRFSRIQMLLQAIGEMVASKNKFRVFLATFLIWGVVLISYDTFFTVNLPGASFGIAGAIFLLFTTTLSFAVPYAFAGVGIFEAAIVYYLIKYVHVVPTKALALALVFHFSMALPQITLLLGVALLHRLQWLPGLKKPSVWLSE